MPDEEINAQPRTSFVQNEHESNSPANDQLLSAFGAIMKLEDLELLLAVAKRGSFAAVAKERNIDPSSVSRTVSDLEGEIGLRMFQRTTRKLSLTEAGDLYLAQIEPLVSELERAREMAARTTATPQGLLRLTASETFGRMRVVPLLCEFRRRYPKVKLECCLLMQTSIWLRNGSILRFAWAQPLRAL
jgi:DNA-binding transcriptional LysR family regulator